MTPPLAPPLAPVLPSPSSTPPAFDDVASFGALYRAAERAARGHKKSPEVAAFLLEREPQICALLRELHEGTYAPRPYRTFEIREPKPRTISAADFRDRVVHHALCAALEPIFEAQAIPTSFACRQGKGVLAALSGAQRSARRHAYVLKLDIHHFFETLSHAVLRRLLRPKVKDGRLFALLCAFIDRGAPGSLSGRGVPIGNLTSQHFANFYLGPLDRRVTRGLRLPYVRYMDDFLLFADDKPTLWQAHRDIEAFVSRQLDLVLKASVTRLLPTHSGVPFLGFAVFPQTLRFSPAHARRFCARQRQLRRTLSRKQVAPLASGGSAEEGALPVAASLQGWASHGDTFHFRKAYQARSGRVPGATVG